MPNGHDQYQGLPPGMTFEAALRSLPADERLVFESYCEGRPDLGTVCDRLNMTCDETYVLFKQSIDRLWGRGGLSIEGACDARRINEGLGPISAPDAREPFPDGHAPSALEIQIGGFMGSSYAVRLEHDSILYERLTDHYEPHCTARVVPTLGGWRDFGRTLDELGVWTWPSKFELPEGEMVLDGTNWSAQIRWGTRSLSSGGSNAFPPSGQVDDADSEVFVAFCGAVSQLVDGRPFS